MGGLVNRQKDTGERKIRVPAAAGWRRYSVNLVNSSGWHNLRATSAWYRGSDSDDATLENYCQLTASRSPSSLTFVTVQTFNKNRLQESGIPIIAVCKKVGATCLIEKKVFVKLFPFVDSISNKPFVDEVTSKNSIRGLLSSSILIRQLVASLQQIWNPSNQVKCLAKTLKEKCSKLRKEVGRPRANFFRTLISDSLALNRASHSPSSIHFRTAKKETSMGPKSASARYAVFHCVKQRIWLNQSTICKKYGRHDNRPLQSTDSWPPRSFLFPRQSCKCGSHSLW